MKDLQKLILFVVFGFFAFISYKYFSDKGELILKDREYANLVNQYARLQKDSKENELQQQLLSRQIDSLKTVKNQISYRYEKQVDTVYSMPDSIVFGLLAKHLDSLYTHRFYNIVKK